MTNHSIILAAGTSTRFSTKEDKLLAKVAGHPVIFYTIRSFQDHESIDTITVVANEQNKASIKKIIENGNFSKVKQVVLGGNTRQESLKNGLLALQVSPEISARADDYLLVHNGANPLVSPEELTDVLSKAQKHGAAICGHYATSTIKEVDNQGLVLQTLDRTKIFTAETPQVTTLKNLQVAIKNAEEKQLQATDESILLESIGEPVATVEASKNNFKITTDSDLEKLRTILGETPKDFLVGFGQDSHLFEQNTKGLTLGGVYFPELPKLKANSDGDVILHAVYNAISQALGGGSLGEHADAECEKGVKDSQKYLAPLFEKMAAQNLKINNLGIMLECKTPKIDPLAPQLRKSLSKILSVRGHRIGITATSGEEATLFGQGQGIQCFSIVSLTKSG